MSEIDPFDLQDFLPYLLNQAAEDTSLQFQATYRPKYGLLRTEWRVLFHLGCYGDMMAKEICERARLHKTKVSRAVSALEARRLVNRVECDTDRRQAMLSLTHQGHVLFENLRSDAEAYSRQLQSRLGDADLAHLRRILKGILT